MFRRRNVRRLSFRDLPKVRLPCIASASIAGSGAISRKFGLTFAQT
jgi:hypothetical protein